MVELRREIYDTLKAWKAESKPECLLIKGARQIGKTYIVRKFGHECYENFIEINFIEHEEFIPIFDSSLDANTIITGITSLLPDAKFEFGKTLLFLDEIQECPNARTALKFLATDERCDVIASGSLLGIKYKRGRKRKPPKSYPVGYERQLTMHSLSFREYLWAKGYANAQLESLYDSFVRRNPVLDPVNEKFHSLVREYIVVGGMPEVVRTFVENGHYGDVQRTQEKILAVYVDDIHKYAEAPDIPKIENCYRAIPRILAAENHKFKYSEDFTPDQYGHIQTMMDLVDKALELMLTILETGTHEIDASAIVNQEHEINNYRSLLRDQNIRDINDRKYAYQTGVYYMDLISELEKIGDYVVNVCEARLGGQKLAQ